MKLAGIISRVSGYHLTCERLSSHVLIGHHLTCRATIISRVTGHRLTCEPHVRCRRSYDIKHRVISSVPFQLCLCRCDVQLRHTASSAPSARHWGFAPVVPEEQVKNSKGIEA
jgi:hypothetical protein